MAKQKLLSGIQATGKPHIGNYFGAMKQFVDMQDDHDALFMIADLHSLTTVKDPSVLRENILNVAIDYLAIGIDPNKAKIFRQSDVRSHTELTWVFNCLTSMPYLMRAHSFKDAEAKSKEVNIGLFDYPMLMAADILLYDPDIVPVGADQKQHLEFTRDTAEKFNNTYGETFKLPEDKILKSVGTIPGNDGRKMSKSYGNHLPLFASDEEIEKFTMSIVTDSKAPEDKKETEGDTLFRLHELFSSEDVLSEVRNGYENGGIGYGDAKKMLVESIKAFVAPLREKRAEIAKDKNHVLDVLDEGGKAADEIAEEKMRDVREKIGLNIS